MERGRGRRVPEVLRRPRRRTSASTSSATYPELLEHGRATTPTSSCASCAAAATIPRRSTRPTRRPSSTEGAPTVILAKTIKGYGLGEAGEGRNITHQQKKLNEEELREFRNRFGIPITDEDVAEAPLLPARRGQPRDAVPARAARASWAATVPSDASTAAVRCTAPRGRALRGVPRGHRRARGGHHHGLRAHAGQAAARRERRQADRAHRARRGAHLRHGGAVPAGAASTPTSGQLYEPVDTDSLLYYNEKHGRRRSWRRASPRPARCRSFIAAGTAYATHGINTIPFFIYYSMFGFQRIGDLIWAAGDMQARGFLIGGTAGRTTLAGEGLQHQDGHSHLLALTVPNLRGLRPGLRLRAGRDRPRRHRAHVREAGERLLLPDGDERELRAAAPCPRASRRASCAASTASASRAGRNARARPHLLGSGTILNEALQAQRDPRGATTTWPPTSGA